MNFKLATVYWYRVMVLTVGIMMELNTFDTKQKSVVFRHLILL